MRYLTTGEVAQITAVEAGPGNLVAIGLLEASVNRPMQTVGGHDAYPGIHDKAAASFHSLARNHVFIDGNKRTAAHR